ncbi:hypothetical protein ACFE04_021015 [Oxalis oulophora]
MSIAEEAQAFTNLEARGNLEEVQASMLKVPGARKGGEDNARVELEVNSEDDDMYAKNVVHPTRGSTSCEVDRNYHVRAGILIVAIEAEGKILDYTSTLAHAKMDPKKKNDVAEDHFRDDEDQTSEFQCLIWEEISSNVLQYEVTLRQVRDRDTFTDLEDKDIGGLISVRDDERDKMLAKQDARIHELSSQHSDLKKVCSRVENEASMKLLYAAEWDMALAKAVAELESLKKELAETQAVPDVVELLKKANVKLSKAYKHQGEELKESRPWILSIL